MQEIQFQHPHRKKHFQFFNQMQQPYFNLVANVDITHFIAQLKQGKERSFTPAIVYVLSKAANAIPQFRWRIRGQQVVEHEKVHPSFSVLTEVADVFSFCYVPYTDSQAQFEQAARLKMEEMKTNPVFEDEAGRDDFLFLSAVPWVSFTSISHPMYLEPADSVPRISWGKYFKQGDRVLMPLAVQAHHAVVDGRQMGAYFEKVQELLDV